MSKFNPTIDDILNLTDSLFGSKDETPPELDYKNQIKLSSLFLDSFRDAYNYRGFERGLKGSRASGKSYFVALEMILRIMRYPWAHGLVIRKINASNKRSTVNQLKQAINKLGVSHLWVFKKQDNEFVYLPTGQTIMIAGLDDSEKITSITVEKGVLAFVWFEEFAEIKDSDEYDKVKQSIRGYGTLDGNNLPEDFFKQITVTLNPWDYKHFSRKYIFENPNEEVAKGFTSTMLDNKYLTPLDKKIYSSYIGTAMEGPAIFGEWGQLEGAVFENIEVKHLDKNELSNLPSYFGLDFGSNDPTAFVHVKVDAENMTLYILDEFYKVDITLNDVAQLIIDKGYGEKLIYADNQAKQSIKTLSVNHELLVKGCKKTRIEDGVNFLRNFHIVIDSQCIYAIDEFEHYMYNNKKDTSKLYVGADHLIDATRYALTKFFTNKKDPEAVDKYTSYLINMFRR